MKKNQKLTYEYKINIENTESHIRADSFLSHGPMFDMLLPFTARGAAISSHRELAQNIFLRKNSQS